MECAVFNTARKACQNIFRKGGGRVWWLVVGVSCVVFGVSCVAGGGRRPGAGDEGPHSSMKRRMLTFKSSPTQMETVMVEEPP
jgi:hypothetical protein